MAKFIMEVRDLELLELLELQLQTGFNINKT